MDNRQKTKNSGGIMLKRNGGCPMVNAFSYLRFSTKKQADGDSKRRQLHASKLLCERHGWNLADLSYQDLGVSAFRGANVNRGELGDFLRAVELGKVTKGSVLVIE